MNWQGHGVCIYSISVDIITEFSKILVEIYTFTHYVREFPLVSVFTTLNIVSYLNFSSSGVCVMAGISLCFFFSGVCWYIICV